MALGPVIPGSALSEHEVVWSEDGSVGAGPDAVHGAGFEVDQDSPGDILATAGLVVVDIDPLELQVGGPCVATGGVNAVLVRDNLPKLKR